MFSEGFSLLRLKYTDILQSLPNDHQQTLLKLQERLADNVICNVLTCTNSYIANKMMLDYLIGGMKCREDMLDFCDQLDKFNDSLDLLPIVHELREGKKIINFWWYTPNNYFHLQM